MLKRCFVVLVFLSALVLLAHCSTTDHEVPLAEAHTMVFEMSENGAIKPYAYFLRRRTLEPKSEREIVAVLAKERANEPIREGHIAIRARNRWGMVIYRTLVEVVLVGHSICCPHSDFRIQQLSFSVVVPASAVSISFDGWQRASRMSISIKQVKAAGPLETSNDSAIRAGESQSR